MSVRDLKKYESDYKELPFEPILVNYRRKVVLKNIKKYEHSSILEIGCGLEPLFKYFKDFSLMTVVEPSEIFYRNASEMKNLITDKRITIYNDILENIAKEIKSYHFDFIIISCLLHELPAPDKFLKELRKLCRKDTIIHINVPNAGSFHRILAVRSGLIKDEFSISDTQRKMQQKSVYNMESLKKILKEHDYNVLDEGSYFLKPFTHNQMQALLDNHIIDEQIIEGLFKIADILPGWGAEIFVNARIDN